MIAFLVDQNFNEHILDGLTRRDAALEFTHVREVDLAAAPDSTILEWAAAHGLVLLTHDRRTVPAFAYERVAAGLPMPGVFLVSDDMPIGQAIDELLMAAHCLGPEECQSSRRWRRPGRHYRTRLPAARNPALAGIEQDCLGDGPARPFLGRFRLLALWHLQLVLPYGSSPGWVCSLPNASALSDWAAS